MEGSHEGRGSADRQTRPDQTRQSGAGDCSARKIGAVQEQNKYYFRRGPQSPTQERQELGVFSSIFVWNEKVVADLAGGEPAFAVDFFVALV